MRLIFLSLWFLVSTIALAAEQKISVSDDASLRQAINNAKPDHRIVIASGRYRPELSTRALHGTQAHPIVIEAADPKNKPSIEGGSLAMHFGQCSHLVLRNLVIRGQTGNGINVDDGGAYDSPSHHITLDGIDVFDIGPRGNRDPIKVSGLDDFVIRNCRIEGWGGQAIDMVGCHRGLIESCTFRGKDGFEQGSGPQTKGGSSNITIRNCTFINAAERGVNIGGSTGLKFFRPPDAKYEAKDIVVEGNRFVGGMAPICFVGVDGATVRYNTIYHPDRWILRILQENTEAGFVPSRKGVFERNLVVFERKVVPVNIGGNTDPKSFVFRQNYWFCSDSPQNSRPQLPSVEQGGIYGTNPKLNIDQAGVLSNPLSKAAKSYGAHALPAAAAE
jgi:hypothetical protein